MKFELTCTRGCHHLSNWEESHTRGRFKSNNSVYKCVSQKFETNGNIYNLTKVKINRVILLERETETNKLCKIARGNQRIQFIISA